MTPIRDDDANGEDFSRVIPLRRRNERATVAKPGRLQPTGGIWDPDAPVAQLTERSLWDPTDEEHGLRRRKPAPAAEAPAADAAVRSGSASRSRDRTLAARLRVFVWALAIAIACAAVLIVAHGRASRPHPAATHRAAAPATKVNAAQPGHGRAPTVASHRRDERPSPARTPAGRARSGASRHGVALVRQRPAAPVRSSSAIDATSVVSPPPAASQSMSSASQSASSTASGPAASPCVPGTLGC
jgi:hypothetical protein